MAEAAKLLEQFGEPATLTMLRPLADRRDAAFRVHVAELAEAELATRQSSGTANGTAQSADFGALLMARTPKQEAVLMILESDIAVVIGRQELGSVSDQVNVMAAALRRASAFCDDPDRAGRADASMLVRWPSASAFESSAVQDRVDLGRIESAYDFAIEHKVPLPQSLERYAASLRPVLATMTETLSLSEFAMWVTRAIVHGDEAEAKAELATASRLEAGATNMTPDGVSSAFRSRLMAATAPSDRERLIRWHWLG